MPDNFIIDGIDTEKGEVTATFNINDRDLKQTFLADTSTDDSILSAVRAYAIDYKSKIDAQLATIASVEEHPLVGLTEEISE